MSKKLIIQFKFKKENDISNKRNLIINMEKLI